MERAFVRAMCCQHPLVYHVHDNELITYSSCLALYHRIPHFLKSLCYYARLFPGSKLKNVYCSFVVFRSFARTIVRFVT